MGSILIVTRHTPLPWEDGAGAYLHDLARFLARSGFRVEILWLAPHEHLRWQKIWTPPPAFDPAIRLRLPGAIRCGRHHFFPSIVWGPLKARTLHRLRQILAFAGIELRRRTLPAASPGPNNGGTKDSPSRGWISPPSADELALVARCARRFRPDVVIANYAWLCPIFDLPALREVKRACLAPDVAWKRAALEAAQRGGHPLPEINRAHEAAWLQSAAIIIAISEADAAELRQLAPAAEVLVAPKAYEPHASPPPVAENSSRLLFVGSGNSFNAEGLEWFLREVWPQILAAGPAATLDVCGSIDRAVMLRPMGVTFHGAVPDLAPFYGRTTVVIVPLLHATGLNIKLVDAAAAGRAIVATSASLAGAPFLRDAVFVADTPADFAATVQRLLSDPAACTAAAARSLTAVRTRLAPEACYGPLLRRLNSR